MSDREIAEAPKWPFGGIEEEEFIKEFGDALQYAWGDFCEDTGCFPDNFTLDGDQLSADFEGGNFVRLAARAFSDEIRKRFKSNYSAQNKAYQGCLDEKNALAKEKSQLKDRLYVAESYLEEAGLTRKGNKYVKN